MSKRYTPGKPAPNPVTPDWIRSVKEHYNLTAEKLGAVGGVKGLCVYRWMGGQRGCKWEHAEYIRLKLESKV